MTIILEHFWFFFSLRSSLWGENEDINIRPRQQCSLHTAHCLNSQNQTNKPNNCLLIYSVTHLHINQQIIISITICGVFRDIKVLLCLRLIIKLRAASSERADHWLPWSEMSFELILVLLWARTVRGCDGVLCQLALDLMVQVCKDRSAWLVYLLWASCLSPNSYVGIQMRDWLFDN